MKIFILIVALVAPLCYAGTVVGVSQMEENKPQQQQQQQQVLHQVQQQQQHVIHQVPSQQQPNWNEYETQNADKGIVTHVTLHRTPTRSMPVPDSVQYQTPQQPHYGVQISHVAPEQGVHVSHLSGNEQGVEHVSHQYVGPVSGNVPVHYHVPEQYPQQSPGVVAVQYVPQQNKPQIGQSVHLVSVPMVHQVKQAEQVPSHEQPANVVSHIVVPLSGHGGVFGVHAEPVGQHNQNYPSHVAFSGQQYPQGVSQVTPSGGHYVVQHPVGVPVNRRMIEEQHKPEENHAHSQNQPTYESQEHYVPQVPVVSHVAILGHITSSAGPHYQPQYVLSHPHQHQQHPQQQQVLDQQNKQN